MSEKGMTVKELYKALSVIIGEGDGDKIVTLSVNYSECDHLQDLQSVHNYDGIDWILLDGKGDVE